MSDTNTEISEQTEPSLTNAVDDVAPDAKPIQQVPQPEEIPTKPTPRKSSPKKPTPRKSSPKKTAAKKTSAKKLLSKRTAVGKAEKAAKALTDVAAATLKVSRRWGTGRERDIRLKAAGFDPQEVARERNRLRNS